MASFGTLERVCRICSQALRPGSPEADTNVGILAALGMVRAVAAGQLDQSRATARSELVKYSGARERVSKTVLIEAQSTAVARATASICNDERRRFGRTSGCGGMLHKLSELNHQRRACFLRARAAQDQLVLALRLAQHHISMLNRT